MGSGPRTGANGALPDLMEINPVAKRPALKPIAIPPADPQPMALRKVVDSQLMQLHRLNAIDADLVDLGAKAVTAFIRTDKRLDLLDAKVDERFDVLEQALGLAKRAKMESGVALDEIRGLKEDLDEAVTSPGFDRLTARPVTRTELEVREMRQRLQESEEAKARLQKHLEDAAKEASEDAKDRHRARRNTVYAIVASLIVAAVTGVVSYSLGHVHGVQSTHEVVAP